MDTFIYFYILDTFTETSSSHLDVDNNDQLTDHYVSELVARVTEHILGDRLVEVANEQSTCCLVVKLIVLGLR